MRPQDLRPGTRGLTYSTPATTLAIIAEFYFNTVSTVKSLHWIVNISLNLIALFPQNKVPLLLSFLYHADDVTIITKVSKYIDVTISL